MDDSLEDELKALLELARVGDTKAFSRFFDLTVGTTFKQVLQLVPREQAEDVLAAVYEAAWAALAASPRVQSPADWITGICFEVAGTWLRKDESGRPAS